MAPKTAGIPIIQKADLQNIITTIILEKSNTFEETDIVDEALSALSRTNVNSRDLIKQMVHKTLTVLMLNDFLNMKNGEYEATDSLSA